MPLNEDENVKKNKVNVVTLGCSKNIFDSEVLMGQLKANNYEVEHESQSDDSSIVIINTCGFIDIHLISNNRPRHLSDLLHLI